MTAMPAGVDVTARWRAVAEQYASTLAAQRAYLDAVSAGTAGDAEPPVAFIPPSDLPPPPPALVPLLETLQLETNALLEQHAELLDRLDRPSAERPAMRRASTPSRPAGLDKAL